MNVLLTGATGFIGRRLFRELSRNHEVRGVTHKNCVGANAAGLIAREMNAETDWSDLVMGCDVVVHTAARVHVMADSAESTMESYTLVNVEGTLHLARQAAMAGVTRFVFLSSIKVNGEWSETGKPLTETDAVAPVDKYAQSKYDAEKALQQLARETGMEVVIIRFPLVYGPGVRGNFFRLMQLVDSRLPLPLGAVNNKRSLIGIDNLSDFITRCLDHPAAANEVFLVSDGEDLSTTDLLKRLARAMGRRSWLIPLPPGMLIRGAHALGKEAVAQRLLGSLQVDISKARQLIGWQPPVSVDEGLKRCVQNNLSQRGLLRLFDIFFSGVGLVICLPIFSLVLIAGWLDSRSPLFFQQRVGRFGQPFTLIKFRTMKLETSSVPTHLAPASSVTTLGRFLRTTKLDELPQLWNVLKGDMSLVGPRPSLIDQDELICERKMRGVLDARPGITGLAQINGIDMSAPRSLAEVDLELLKTLTVKDYFLYIFKTLSGKGAGDRVAR